LSSEWIEDHLTTSQIKINDELFSTTEVENVKSSSTKASKVNKKDPAKFDFQSSKKILFYNSWFDWPDFHFGLGNYPFSSRNCPVQNCFTTTNRSLLGKKMSNN